MPTTPTHVSVGNVTLGNDLPFVLIAGPDSIESMDHAMKMARALKELCDALGIGLIFKGCFDKSQRTSITGWRGIGLDAALPVYERIKNELGVPVTADFSTVEEVERMSKTVDLLQYQARMMRLTDPLVAAGTHGRAVNIKRSHGESPNAVPGAIGKVESTGNRNIIVTERGSVFGHDDIIVDMRLLERLKRHGYPVCLDVSHTCQKPSADNGKSGGDREDSPPLARAGVAVGVAAIFMEVHDDPDHAPVDGPHSMRLDRLPDHLKTLKAIDAIVKGR